MYLAPADSDAEGSDFVISADECDGDGEPIVLKKNARSRYLALLEGEVGICCSCRFLIFLAKASAENRNQKMTKQRGISQFLSSPVLAMSDKLY